MPFGTQKYVGGAFGSSQGSRRHRRRRKVAPSPPPPNPFALEPARLDFDPDFGYRFGGDLSFTPQFNSALHALQTGRDPEDPDSPRPFSEFEKLAARAEERRRAADDPVALNFSDILGLIADDNALAPNPARDLIEDEADNLVTAVKQSWGVEGDGQLPGVIKAGVTKEQAQALATILSPVPVGNAAKLARGLRATEEALSGAKAGSAIWRGAERVPAIRAAAEAAAKQAGRVPAPIRAAAKVGAKGVSYPVRHPIQAPLAAQAPVAAFQGDPSEMVKALSGQGLYASAVGDLAGEVGGIPGEAVSLSAAVVPSLFLTGKAGVKAAGGDSEEAEQLFDEWKDTGLLPALGNALATGDWGHVGDVLGDHPLYAGLEASGLANAAGRIAGAGLRAVPGKNWAGLERSDLTIPGTKIAVGRQYSRDAFRQLGQRYYDRKGWNDVEPGTQRAAHYEKQAANRFTTDQETTRRLHGRERVEELQDILPKKWLGGRKLDRKSAEAVPLAVERILQDPSTFAEDLPIYKRLIDRAANERDESGRPVLNKQEMKRNRENAKIIDDALESGNPEKIVKAADAFIEIQKPILDEMVELGLVTPERAGFASALPWARIHMGAEWSPEAETLIDAAGKPITMEQITTRMKRAGVEPPGFLSHKAPTAGDFYQPAFGGGKLDSKSRSGAAVLGGMQQGGIEGLVRQLRRSQGLVDRARGWNEAITQFGITLPGVKTVADARKVMEDPAHYGLRSGQEVMVVPRYPFNANKDEIMGALSHQDPISVDEGAGALINQQIDALNAGNLPDDTPVALVPRKVGEQLRKDAEPSGTELKAMQAATNVFKRAVLPFSPSFYIGNVFDNYMRTLMAGINPAHVYLGVKGTKALSTERREQINQGALYTSVERLSPHRSVENVARGTGSVARTMREMAEWSHKQGVKQAVVKAVPKAVAETSKALLSMNRLVSERLPSYGVLGKAVAQEIRTTQGSWMKAVAHHGEAVKAWAKGVDDPAARLKLQRQLETTLGNYSQMSPGARKVLSNVVPFWTWMRAAYKYVYLTMPAHRSVQTGFLAASAMATQVEREQEGLEKGGLLEPEVEGELDSWQQGGIPVGNGMVIPMAGYNSFGYASDPTEAISKAGFAQVKNTVDALGGVDWRGNPIPYGDRIPAAIMATFGAAAPGFNQLFRTNLGKVEFDPHLTLPKPYEAQEAEDKILVPTGGGGGSGGGIWRSGPGSSGGGGLWR